MRVEGTPDGGATVQRASVGATGSWAHIPGHIIQQCMITQPRRRYTVHSLPGTENMQDDTDRRTR